MNGPGDIVAGLAPPQDNAPAVAWRRPGPVDTEPHNENAAGNEGGMADALATQGANNLIGFILASWARNKRARDIMEERLLSCLRARRAKYTAAELQSMWTVQAGAGDAIYLPLAASKMRQAEGALRDLILPDGEPAWGLEPIPLSELPADIEELLLTQAVQQAKMAMQDDFQQNQKITDLNAFRLKVETLKSTLRDAHIEEEQKIVKSRARRMEKVIEKRKQEGDWDQALSDFIQYFCTFPTAILKGPFQEHKKVRAWEGNRSVIKNVIRETWAAVHPMDCYPAPGASSPKDGDFFERLRLTRTDLYDMIGLPQYDELAIRRCLEYHQTGGLRAWLWSDMERRQIEGQTHTTWLPDYQIDALHYWGSVQGIDLISHGIVDGVADPLAFYEVDAIVIGNEVIRCVLNDDPLGDRPYWAASYDDVPNSFWGNAIYELIYDCCNMVNALVRSLNANMGLASGPICGIDMSQLVPGQNPQSLRPLMLLQLDGSTATTARKPLEFFQAESQAVAIFESIRQFEDRADLLSGIPRYLGGDSQASGAAETLGGLSLLMSNAAKGLRRACSSIDRRVIKKTLEKVYDREMAENPDETIKGACQVVARGSSAVIVKEHLQQVRNQFLTTILSSPKLLEIIGNTRLANLCRAIVNDLDLQVDDIFPTEAEMDQIAAAAQNAPPPQPDPNAQLQAKVDLASIDSKERIAGARVGVSLAKDHLVPMAAAILNQHTAQQTAPMGQPQPQPQPSLSPPSPPPAPGL